MAKSKADRIRIEITNPAPGGHTQTSLAHARRYVKRGIAELANGELRFFRHESTAMCSPCRTSPTPIPVAPRIQDARPEMPVLPPTPEWLRSVGYDVFGKLTRYNASPSRL